MKKILIGILAIVLLVALYTFVTYNGFVRTNEAVDNKWAQVESQYQRRFDLIPNLVESTKGILTQEQKVFGDIAEARTRYSGATTINEKAGAATQLEGALGRLLVIVEAYPVLRSSENIQALMTELEGTENRISVERKRFNDAVQIFNVRIKGFPNNILASMFGFSERTYFEAVENAETPPVVDLVE